MKNRLELELWIITARLPACGMKPRWQVFLTMKMLPEVENSIESIFRRFEGDETLGKRAFFHRHSGNFQKIGQSECAQVHSGEKAGIFGPAWAIG
jgi:hypothetical protein